MLDNEFGKAFSDEPFFNEKFIKRNKIKKITGRYSKKAINDKIRKDSNVYVYEFSPEGRLVKQYRTLKIGKTWDTIVQQYEYDTEGKITVHRKSDQYGFYATIYSYDTSGRVVEEEFRRDLNTGKNKLDFKLDKALSFNHETSSYYVAPLQEKRTFYNSYDRPFKNHFKYFDEDGYLLKEETILKMSRIRTEKAYTYNDKGFLGAIEITSTSKNNPSTKEEYFYDQLNNLEQIKYYKNGVYEMEKQLLYNRVSKLLKTVLIREVKSNLITILALDEYEFYP